MRSSSLRRPAALVAATVLVLGAAACSDDTTSGSGRTSTTVAVSAPTTGPLRTSTTVEGEPVESSEIYQQAGLTPDQAACVEASGIADEFVATPGADEDSPTVLESDRGRVEVPATVRTGAELERVMLAGFAADCAPFPVLDRLAMIDGAANDAVAISELLPLRLEQRRVAGATAKELDCLGTEFREAPALLASLIADPARVEAECASASRRAAWRKASLDAGLSLTSATEEERDCLTDLDDLVDLAELVDAVEAGGEVVDPEGGSSLACVDAGRRRQIALDIVAKQATFLAENLAAPGT